MRVDPIYEEYIDERTGEKHLRIIPAETPRPPVPSIPHIVGSKAKTNLTKRVRMVGLLFARSDSPLAKKEIIPSLEYFHDRSGEHIDFYCPGYASYHPNTKPTPLTRRKVVRIDDENTFLVLSNSILVEKELNHLLHGSTAVELI
jgi:hypothetical protein